MFKTDFDEVSKGKELDQSAVQTLRDPPRLNSKGLFLCLKDQFTYILFIGRDKGKGGHNEQSTQQTPPPIWTSKRIFIIVSL